MTDARAALALVPDAGLAKLQATPGWRVVAVPNGDAVDAKTALVHCAANPIHFVVIAQRADGSDVALCKLFRSIGFPVLLLASSANPVQINAARKAMGASIAIGSTFSDADLAAAVRTLSAEHPVPPDRKEVKHEALTPAAQQDPAWTLGRYCLRNSTGSLRLGASGGAAEITILLSNGAPVVATTNVRGPRLGEILVRKGRLTAEQLERAVRVIERKKDVRIGTVLVDQGVLTRDEMLREVGAQYATRIFTAFAWPAVSPTVRFEEVKLDDARIPGTREALLAEGVRRQYDAIRLKALLPHTATFKWAPDAASRFSSFSFSAKEAAALLPLDGAQPLSAVLSRAESPLDAFRALYAAACLDLIRL